MTRKEEANAILSIITKMYPNARIELNFQQDHELLFAILLSAQTTDIAVNKVTKSLFEAYNDLKDYANADLNDLENHIKTIGLYRNKAKNLQLSAKMILEDYGGIIPKNQTLLEKLPGVGRKTANVYLSELHKIPRIAVDTHVSRVSIRLGLAKKRDSVLEIEKKLMKTYPKEFWIDLHHKFIHFGRYFCTAKKPKCRECPLIHICKMPMI